MSDTSSPFPPGPCHHINTVRCPNCDPERSTKLGEVYPLPAPYRDATPPKPGGLLLPPHESLLPILERIERKLDALLGEADA